MIVVGRVQGGVKWVEAAFHVSGPANRIKITRFEHSFYFSAATDQNASADVWRHRIVKAHEATMTQMKSQTVPNWSICVFE